jgi:NTP pyrophosphatase (non-canonical NTP hydrolase)
MKQFDTYQEAAATTVKDSIKNNPNYFALGLAGETGEVMELIKKATRDGSGVGSVDKSNLTKELGDVLWYISQLAKVYGISLGEVADKNLEKLRSRKERDVIGGSGDNR